MDFAIFLSNSLLMQLSYSFSGVFQMQIFRSIDSNSVRGFPKDPKDATSLVSSNLVNNFIFLTISVYKPPPYFVLEIN